MNMAISASRKFADPRWTLDGSKRASVSLRKLETLWINTGTLCNIECASCYIESSPTNDRLSYISRAEVKSYLDEIRTLELGTREIGLTGGEPFMNPECCDIIGDALAQGFSVLVLTNAMKPMTRPRVQKALLSLNDQYGERLTVRVSLDHYTRQLHERERGEDTWQSTLAGLKWLSQHGFHLNLAGRTCWDEPEQAARAGYSALCRAEGINIDCADPARLVLFPEMDAAADVPEITVDCWDILKVRAEDMMCATSRMVVKRKGALSPEVVACTLLPYDPGFVLGPTLAQSRTDVSLNHPHCAKFCVLGGGSCSVSG